MLGRHSLEWAAIARQRRCALLDEAKVERLLRRRHGLDPTAVEDPCGPDGAPVVVLPLSPAARRVSRVA